MKRSISNIIYYVLLLEMTACCSYPEEVIVALKQAGPNRKELKKVLQHYKGDTLGYPAACFLIENMRWHGMGVWEKREDRAFRQRFEWADSIYYQITGGVSDEILRHGMMSKWLEKNAERFNEVYGSLKMSGEALQIISSSDLQTVKADFLISHIDNAIRRWKNSFYCRNLSFEDFCEYILPYRALEQGMCLDGGRLSTRTLRHLDRSEPPVLTSVIERYRFYIENIRKMMGKRPDTGLSSAEDIFFQRERDCVPQCDYECQVLRACGVPAAIDINIGNREFVGQHHHCVVFDSAGRSLPFHAETGLSKDGNWGYALEYKLNVYRNMYGAQKDSPYMLRKAGEALPEGFRSPAIREVTDYLKKTYPVRLKIPVETNTRLAWLYSYSRNDRGCMAVTWGVIDTVTREVCFEHVVPNVLYFPAYLGKDGEPYFWSDPLFVYEGLNGTAGVAEWAELIGADTTKRTDLLITRKFPRKPNMLKLAADMVGGKFYGANEADGKDKKELYCITKMPEACLNEYPLDNRRAWRYYIYEAPGNRWADISVLEFLADSSRLYPDTGHPLPCQFFSPEEVKAPRKSYMKLMPEKPDNSPEYDGNMQTSSSRHRIVYQLKEPRVVSCIRMAPKNADNIIRPGEDYDLFYWDKGWQHQMNVKSRYNYLHFQGLRTDRLYWLRNNTRGREEVPFLIRKGKPVFIYYDILKKPVWEKIDHLPRKGWRCRASSEEPSGGPYEPGYAYFMLDGKPETHWHTQYTGFKPDYPHWFVVDAREQVEADGFLLTPRGHDITCRLKIEISDNGKEWKDLGEFKLQNKGTEQQICMDRRRKFRYFRVTCLEGYEKTPYTSMAEVALFRKEKIQNLEF